MNRVQNHYEKELGMDSIRANPMDTAADQAIKELTTKVVTQLSAKEKDGAQKLIEWLKDWKSAAGYKRLGRYLISLKVNGPE